MPDHVVVQVVHAVIRCEAHGRDTPFGAANADAEGLLRVPYRRHHVSLIPDAGRRTQDVVSNMPSSEGRGSGYQGYDVTLERLDDILFDHG